MARLLRHEVGDLLQSVYSTVAVLLDRLPADLSLERRLAAELKGRAELCKSELDAVVELASPAEPAADRADLAATLEAALVPVRRRYPSLAVAVGEVPGDPVAADARALANALWLLFRSLGQAARQQLSVRFVRGDRHVDCCIERDGYPVTPEQLAWLRTPFCTTQNATFGLGLALLRRAVQPAGVVEATNGVEGGVVVRIRFPVCSEV
jgi:C4-dicarboxylate-specific signal transduction histidine kinase